MADGLSIRVHRIADGAHVVSLAGELDVAAVVEVSAELERLAGGRVVVDLLDLTFLDAAGLSTLTDASRHSQVTVVGDPRTLHIFELSGAAAQLRLDLSLASAVASVSA